MPKNANGTTMIASTSWAMRLFLRTRSNIDVFRTARYGENSPRPRAGRNAKAGHYGIPRRGGQCAGRARSQCVPAPRGRESGLVEAQAAATRIHADAVARAEAAFEDGPRQRVLDLLLDRPLERTGAIHRVEAGLGDVRDRGVRDLQRHLQPRQPALQVLQLDARDVGDVLVVERVEHHDLVDAVDELGPEEGLHLG